MSSPRLPVFYTALLALGSVYSPESDPLTLDLNCIAVYDAGAA